MKRITILSLAAITACTVTLGSGSIKTAHAEDQTLNPDCKSAYLCDYQSGTQVYAKNETERLPIASMCKIMTLLL